jgi:quercetin dioxygenase-like cupin family protein
MSSEPASPFADNLVLELAQTPWVPDVPGIRARQKIVSGRRWAVVEYAPGARRQEWCEDGHAGFVLEGEIEFEFAGGEPAMTFRAGDGFALATGTGHRGRCPGDSGVRMFLIDDPA